MRGKRTRIGLALTLVIAAGALTAAPAPASNPLRVTASKPPGLLAALHKAIGHVYSYSELVFTYRADPKDAHWLSWLVMPAPGYQDKVQGGAGYAHRVGAKWEIWGPGTNLAGLGCSAQGALPVIPASVLEAFGQSCGSSSAATATAPVAKGAPPLRYVGPRVIKFHNGHKGSVSLAGDFVVPTNTSCDRTVSPTTCKVHGHSFTGPRVCAGALPLVSGYFHWQQPRVGSAGGLVGCTIVYSGHRYLPDPAPAPMPREWDSNPSVIRVYSSINGGTLLAGPFVIRLELVGKPASNASSLQLSGTLSTGGVTFHLSGSSSPSLSADSGGGVQGSSTMQESLTVQGSPGAGCTMSGGVHATVLYRWSGEVVDPRTDKAQIVVAEKGSATGSISLVCNVQGQHVAVTVPAGKVIPNWSSGRPVTVYLDDHSPQVLYRTQTALGTITVTLTIPK